MIFLVINPSFLFASRFIVGRISLFLLLLLLEWLLVIFWPKKLTKSVALFPLQVVILQLLSRWQCVSELQLSLFHRNRLLHGHDVVNKDIVVWCNRSGHPQAGDHFLCTSSWPNPKNGLKVNTHLCSFQKFGNEPRSCFKYVEDYWGFSTKF